MTPQNSAVTSAVLLAVAVLTGCSSHTVARPVLRSTPSHTDNVLDLHKQAQKILGSYTSSGESILVSGLDVVGTTADIRPVLADGHTYAFRLVCVGRGSISVAMNGTATELVACDSKVATISFNNSSPDYSIAIAKHGRATGVYAYQFLKQA